MSVSVPHVHEYLPVDVMLRGRPNVPGEGAHVAHEGTQRARDILYADRYDPLRCTRDLTKLSGGFSYRRAKPGPSQADVDAAVAKYRAAGGTVTRCPDMACESFNNGFGFGA